MNVKGLISGLVAVALTIGGSAEIKGRLDEKAFEESKKAQEIVTQSINEKSKLASELTAANNDRAEMETELKILELASKKSDLIIDIMNSSVLKDSKVLEILGVSYLEDYSSIIKEANNMKKVEFSINEYLTPHHTYQNTYGNKGYDVICNLSSNSKIKFEKISNELQRLCDESYISYDDKATIIDNISNSYFENNDNFNSKENFGLLRDYLLDIIDMSYVVNTMDRSELNTVINFIYTDDKRNNDIEKYELGYFRSDDDNLRKVFTKEFKKKYTSKELSEFINKVIEYNNR